MHEPSARNAIDGETLAAHIRQWGEALGFQAVGFSKARLTRDKRHLQDWLERNYHGDMHYMERHAALRMQPRALVAGTITVISARMDYWPGPAADAETVLQQPSKAYVSRYALGRDYHKVLRRRLARLAQRIERAIGPFGHRVFSDSAPVLEKALARDAGLGWIGKHTNLLHRDAGSWFFLGEIYTDLELPADAAPAPHCGTCRACIDICPTNAIVAPYRLDARRCISYLTIELHGAIPVALRPMLGNRIYGCDDCQLVCPWNRFARPTPETDFLPRHGLDAAGLVDLFAWTAEEFDQRTRGSAIRRIGYERWLRNIAVALGNGPADTEAIRALEGRADHGSALVREHVAWALQRLRRGGATSPETSPTGQRLAGEEPEL